MNDNSGIWAVKNWLIRTVIRCAYIFFAALIAAMFPYFGDILGEPLTTQADQTTWHPIYKSLCGQKHKQKLLFVIDNHCLCHYCDRVSCCVSCLCLCVSDLLAQHIFAMCNAHPAWYVSHASTLQADMRLLPMHKPYHTIIMIRFMTHLKVLLQHFPASFSHVSYFCSSGGSARHHPPRLLTAPGNVHLPAQASVVEKDPGLDPAHLLCHCHDSGRCCGHSWNCSGCK